MSKRKTILCAAGMLAVFCLLLSGCAEKEEPSFKTDYQAIFMDNGQAFFGKLENSGSDYPLLRDVYYIGRQASPDGKDKEVKNILIKRGNEWHGPEYMYINARHIVVMEPVSPLSRVAQLMKEAKTAQPQTQATEPAPPEGTGGK